MKSVNTRHNSVMSSVSRGGAAVFESSSEAEKLVFLIQDYKYGEGPHGRRVSLTGRERLKTNLLFREIYFLTRPRRAAVICPARSRA
jgi:hypothetical protein